MQLMPPDNLSKVGDAWFALEPGEAVHVTATPAPLGAEGRSPQWPALERTTVAAHPWCACCGAKQELQVHHVTPYHVDPSEELDPGNLIVLCKPHHLLVGHLMNWRSWNVDVVKDAALWLKKIHNRPHLNGLRGTGDQPVLWES